MRDIVGGALSAIGLPLAIYAAASLPTIWPDLAPVGLSAFLGLAPFLGAGLGAVLCWRFKKSRAVFALLLVAATCWLFREAFQGGPGREPRLLLLHAAWTALVPLNLALFAYVGDRGVTSVWGQGQIVLLGAQGGLLALFSAKAAVHSTIQVETARLFTARFLPAMADGLAPLPHLAVLTALIAGGYLLWRAAERGSSLDAAFCGAFLALTAAMRQPGGSAASGLYFSAACAMILAGLLQDSWRMAFLDELTGIPGRRALLADVKRLGGRYAMAMVDVDHFKKFNDTYGHDVGDHVLRMVAAQLARVTGGGKSYRYGGEEFTVVFPRKSVEEAVPHLEALREAIASAGFQIRSKDRPEKKPAKPLPKKKGDKVVSVTVSMGVAERNERRPAVEEVLKAADVALYEAKKNGRNQVAAA